MSTLKPKQYAKGLMAAAKGEDPGGIDAIVSRLFADLSLRGMTRMIPAVIREVQDIADREQGIVSVKVICAHADEKAEALIKKELQKLYGAAFRLEISIDPSLIDGVIIQAGDTRIDASARHSLDRLRAYLVS